MEQVLVEPQLIWRSSPRSLREEAGAQTYLGATLKPGGLSLISYINPRVYSEGACFQTTMPML